MTCASLLYSGFAAFATNRKECKLEAGVAFDVVDGWRQEDRVVARFVPSPPVHVPLPADKGELAYDALRIVFQLHAGCLGSFADDEFNRLALARDAVDECSHLSDRVNAIGVRGVPLVRRQSRKNAFLGNLEDAMITRIRKLSHTFIPFGTFAGGRLTRRAIDRTSMIECHIVELYYRHIADQGRLFEAAEWQWTWRPMSSAADPY